MNIPIGIDLGLGLFLAFAGIGLLAHGFTLIKIEKHYHNHCEEDDGK